MNAEEAAHALDGAKQRGNKWRARCPVPGHGQVHGDVHPSLELEDKPNGTTVVFCRANCAQNHVIAALRERGIVLDNGASKSPGRRTMHRKRAEENAWTPIAPVPDGTPPPDFIALLGREPTAFWDYLNSNDQLLGYTVRFDLEDGAKEFRPVTYCRNERGERAWRVQAWKPPRPLYGLPFLAERPDDPVLVVEGEKTAVAAVELLGDECVIVTWPGGAKADHLADYGPLKSRRVTCWPDNDPGGRAAMRRVAMRALEVGAAEARVVRLPPPLPVKWDLADDLPEGWDASTVRRLIDEAEPFAPSGTNHDAVPATASPDEEPREPFRLTDLGNAERFVRAHGDGVRWCEGRGWLVWDGKRFAPDETRRVHDFAASVARSIWDEVANAPDLETRKLLAKFAAKSEQVERIRAMVEVAKPMLAVRADQLDADPWLLNVLNGTLDLRTGILRPHDRRDLMTKLAPVAFDPNAECPIWDKFLERTFGANVALIEFVQRAVGYCLTGDTRDHSFFLAHGPTATGKTTLTNTVARVLGDYARRAAPETFLDRRAGQASNDLARLAGARFVVVTETERAKKLAEGLVKSLTGGDTTVARHLYREHFEFAPTFKLWIATNHRPRASGDDDAIWRRLRLIPFEHQVPEPERDPALPDKLAAEPLGILAWAVCGCLEWQRHGLKPPQRVREATAAYQQESDQLGRFIEEGCELRADAEITVAGAYGGYKSWAEQSGERPMSKFEFGRQLEQRGCERMKGTGGTRMWRGITLRVA